MESSTIDWMQQLHRLDGVYECPKHPDGSRKGPLVTYAGKDAHGRYFVGDTYVNMAKLENHPDLLKRAARELVQAHSWIKEGTAVCGLPMGGLAFGLTVANVMGMGVRYFYPDQEVIEGTRKKRLKFDRHDGVARGQKVILVEDVLNNFSTTAETIELVNQEGGTVVGIVGILNRSLTYDDYFQGVRVGALIRRKIMEYEVDHPYVAKDVENGNVVLKPKFEWGRLKAAMKMAR
jgi:orotate phosphoribosyltransferase